MQNGIRFLWFFGFQTFYGDKNIFWEPLRCSTSLPLHRYTLFSRCGETRACLAAQPSPLITAHTHTCSYISSPTHTHTHTHPHTHVPTYPTTHTHTHVPTYPPYTHPHMFLHIHPIHPHMFLYRYPPYTLSAVLYIRVQRWVK